MGSEELSSPEEGRYCRISRRLDLAMATSCVESMNEDEEGNDSWAMLAESVNHSQTQGMYSVKHDNKKSASPPIHPQKTNNEQQTTLNRADVK